MIIKDCPMKVQIFSNKNSSAKNSKISGAGLSHSTAGVETKILLETFDSFGNKGLGGEADTIRIELVKDDQEENIEKMKFKKIKIKIIKLHLHAMVIYIKLKAYLQIHIYVK